MIAQKFLHDAIYTLSTWTTICCKPRPDIDNRNLHLTERLILKHIKWSVSRIANEETIANLYEQIMNQNVSNLQHNYRHIDFPLNSTLQGFDLDAQLCLRCG
jgi:hypothetical protein